MYFSVGRTSLGRRSTLPTDRSRCTLMNVPIRSEQRKAVGRFATVKVTDSFEHTHTETHTVYHPLICPPVHFGRSS